MLSAGLMMLSEGSKVVIAEVYLRRLRAFCKRFNVILK